MIYMKPNNSVHDEPSTTLLPDIFSLRLIIIIDNYMTYNNILLLFL